MLIVYHGFKFNNHSLSSWDMSHVVFIIRAKYGNGLVYF